MCSTSSFTEAKSSSTQTSRPAQPRSPTTLLRRQPSSWPTPEQVADLNQAVRGRLVNGGRVDDSRAIVTHDGERIGVGNRVATRRNASHLSVENTGAASAYVAMTRGRESNTVHLVAENLDDARQQWVLTFARNRADLGPAHAATLAAEDAGKYEPYVAPREQQPAVPSAAERARRHSSYGSQSPRSGPGIGR